MPGVRVVLFSGRTAADLAGRTRIGGVTYLGDHGVERADVPRGFRLAAMRIATMPATDVEQRIAQLLADVVPRDVPEGWLVVERKSAAVTFHFRTAPDVGVATAQVRASIDRHDPDSVLERHPGRRADRAAAAERVVEGDRHGDDDRRASSAIGAHPRRRPRRCRGVPGGGLDRPR